MQCAFCMGPNGHETTDHVVHRFRFKKDPTLAAVLGFDVNDPENKAPACHSCNSRKGTLRLVPASHAHLLPLLNARGRVKWQIWDGGKLPKVQT